MKRTELKRHTPLRTNEPLRRVAGLTRRGGIHTKHRDTRPTRTVADAVRDLVSAVRHRLHTAKCATGCYCVKDRFVFRCVTCGHIC